MKFSLKRILYLAMAMLLIFSLTACGGDNNNTESINSQNASKDSSGGSVSVIDRAESSRALFMTTRITTRMPKFPKPPRV